MSELNPNHPTTAAMRDQWHKIVTLLMHKMGEMHVVITEEDVMALNPDQCIVVQGMADGIHIRLVTPEEGMAIARSAGGMLQ